MKKVGNAYGVAALMGNLYVESKLNPMDLQGAYEKKLNMTDKTYTEAVDNGSYTREQFAHDSAGYGLAQWTFYARKESLYDFAKAGGYSIGSLNMQLEFLWNELQAYKTVLKAVKSATSVREASDVIVKRYEKPANQSEKFLQNRANYGLKYYEKFAKESSSPETKKISTVVATANVNIRTGNGKSYKRVGVLQKDCSLPWVATSENKWYAVEYNNAVCWVSGEFAVIKA